MKENVPLALNAKPQRPTKIPESLKGDVTMFLTGKYLLRTDISISDVSR